MRNDRFSRRSFLKASAAGTAGLCAPGLLGARGAAAAESPFLDQLGVALYTVRDQMKADAAGTLKAIAGLGYRYVETNLLPALGAPLKAAGLKQVSAYAPTYLITGNRQAWAGTGELLPESYTWSQAIEEAKKQGLEYLVIVYLMKEERGGRDVYRDLAARLVKAGEACRKAGLGLAYHAHAFEYEPAADGVRPIQVLLDETPKDLLGLELDTFWSSLAGVHPVNMVEHYAGRIPLVHLKDKATVPIQFDETKVPKEAFQEIGAGVVDFKAFLPAAAKAGVKYYYVEQDHCAGSPLDSLRTSRQALVALAAGKA